MPGFGDKKKKAPKKLASTSHRRTPDELKKSAIRNHIAGKTREAEYFYEAFLETGKNDPDILSNFALICQESGRIKKALKMYEDCIRLFPSHAFSCTNLGYLYLIIGELEKAEEITRKAIELDPKIANAHSTLGLILKEKGNIEEAEVSIRKSIEIKPDLYDSYINLGIVLKSKGELKEAEEMTLKALDIDPKSADAYLNLGTILQERGDYKQAEEVTRKAIMINPKINDANINLAVILKELGKLEQAVFYAKQELEISPDNKRSYCLLNILLQEAELSKLSVSDVRSVLKKLLLRKDISHQDLFRAIDSLISKNKLEEIYNSDSNNLKPILFKQIINDKEIIQALKLLTFNSLNWELALTKIRRSLCIQATNPNFKPQKALLEFTMALAEQCFLNEYIYFQEEDEKSIIELIEHSISESEITQFHVSLLACYKPLYKLNQLNKEKMKFSSKSSSFNSLIELQYNEPLEEMQITKSIKKIGNINDSVSVEVKTQYEQNPYPRWRYTSYISENKMTIISAINNEIKPNRIENENENEKKKCQVLIAGCGTGKQIFDATGYINAEITAIDLSSSSIAYAQRKANEYGIENIRFIEMDILQLPLLNEKFDLIECSGVLHHMHSPEKGLGAIINSLESSGYLKLGLYSELARQEVVKARKIISDQNIEADNKGISFFRNSIFNKELPPLTNLFQWSDFYTTSMCRDLCFHVQEHRYSINAIKVLLNRFNLDFLGFILPHHVKSQYAKLYPNDKTQVSLENWNKYEERYPNTFRSMFQFWVKKNEYRP